MPLRGLTVGADRTLRLDGVRFRNIGLNYGGAIVRIYGQTSAATCAYTPAAEQDAMLDVCDALKVKVLRVKATPYWPAQWRWGVNGGVAGVAALAADREAHYQKIDAFVAKCRARGIGVILTLFFRHASVCDLAGQTVRAGWLNAGATRTYATAVTQEIVTRYLNEEAVYGYEWSNEVNHYNDATDTTLAGFPGADPTYGTPSSYAAADTSFLGEDLANVLTWWYGVVRAIDSNRIVLTGNGPNSYTLQHSRTAGINTPLSPWHRDQVRDNPTNCGCIHFYGNLPYTSPSFRGLNPLLTGVRHWQAQAGRAFVFGEFGNQPWTLQSLNGDGSTLTITTRPSDSGCPIEPGDELQLGGTSSVFDGVRANAATVSADRKTITVPCPIPGSWVAPAPSPPAPRVKGLQYMSGARVARMCRDIIDSGTDVALFWMLDSDPLRPLFESIDSPGNEGQRAAILAANTELGW